MTSTDCEAISRLSIIASALAALMGEGILITPSFSAIRVMGEHRGFGAEITGLDLSAPLSAEVLADIHRAWCFYSVIWFHAPSLEAAALEMLADQLGAAFAERSSPPIQNVSVAEHQASRLDGASPGLTWRSENSFATTPPAVSLIHAGGSVRAGAILFASGHRAYDTLSPLLKMMIAPFRCAHAKSYDAGLALEAGRCSHPLVRTHPITGRRALYINPAYTVGVDGMSEAEASSLLGFLFKHMTEDAFVLRLPWRANQLFLIDNRCVMYRTTSELDDRSPLGHWTCFAAETPV